MMHRGALTSLLLAAFLACTHAQMRLPSYNVSPDNVTVSGFSAGAMMAMQLHVAYSSLFKGAGILSGAPYYCAEGFQWKMVTACSFLPSTFSLRTSIDEAKRLEEQDLIDPLDNLTSSRVYIYNGKIDIIVPYKNGEHVASFYREFITDGTAIYTEFSVPSQHAAVTDKFGNPCIALEPPLINNCGYDQVGVMFRHIYNRELEPRVDYLESNLLTFRQSEFIPRVFGMDEVGYIYVPTACQNGSQCSLHVALHGCLMAAELDFTGTEYVEFAGYNRWAEANNIIILYPQTTRGTLFLGNGLACWDFYGYTNPYGNRDRYVTRDAPQMEAIYNMIQRILGNPTKRIELKDKWDAVMDARAAWATAHSFDDEL